MTRSTLALSLAVLVPLPLACILPPGGTANAPAESPTSIAAADDPAAAEVARRIETDPGAYLNEILARADALEQYRLTFYRQERLGDTLRATEEIQALFRKQPFSVKFTWDSPDADYYESVYVDGQNNNKLVVRERRGALPFVPPTIRRVDPMDAVRFGRARSPVTDFGLATIARKTVAPFDNPDLRPQLTIAYQGLINLDPRNRPTHRIHIEHPPLPGLQYTVQDYYVDVETGLPAGTDLYLSSGELAARYRYVDVDTNVQFTDADFQLSSG